MPDVSKITLPTGTTYDIKDSVARAQIGGAIVLRGTTTTALEDEAATNPIVINGQSYTAIANDAVFYGKQEYVFDGTYWHEFGDMSGLGDLAMKDTASANYTPTGNVTVNEAGSTTTVNSITDVGTLPVFTATVANETLSLSFSQGTLPTKSSDTTVKTGDATYSFGGTQTTITVS